MSIIRVASRYAQSLLLLALEKGKLEAVHRDMQMLLRLGGSNPDLGHMLKSPIVSSDKKLNVLKAVFDNKSEETTLEFFELVAEKDRSDLLIDIANEFLRQYNTHQGIQVAEVTTAFELGDALRKEFIQMAKNISGLDKVELNEKVNPEIIGGFKLKVNDWQLDESLASKLNALRLEFSKNLYEKQY
jgi:F-type H+-transporting ATPase subunit delta